MKSSQFNIIIIVFTFTIIIISLFLIWIVSLPAFFPSWVLAHQEIGWIGDAIGGITSPIISLATAILLFITLNKQTEANRNQQTRNESDIIFMLMSQLENEINAFYSKVKKNGVEFRYDGLEGLIDFSNFVSELAEEKNPQVTINDLHQTHQFIFITRSYRLIEEKIKVGDLPKGVKDILERKLVIIYNSYLKYTLESIMTSVASNQKISHFIFDELKTFYSGRQTTLHDFIYQVQE